MLAKTFSAAINGLDAQIIEVEVETSYGLRRFDVVGLPDKSVQEAKERVDAAIAASGFKPPRHEPVKVLVSLAPADLKKEGALYDLPIALGYLAADKKIKIDPENKIFLGELALDGALRPAKGAISFAIACRQKGIKKIILPEANAAEAALIEGVEAIGVKNLAHAIAYLEGKTEILPEKSSLADNVGKENENRFDMIAGQESAKRALEIVAGGGHNLSMWGPPGTGKTLLAKSLPEIMPPLAFEESIEVTKIYSVCGLLDGRSLISKRPFRAPHHTASDAALIGGGNPPRPGEITLAHQGILFLDEFPEFHRDALEALRQPLEEGAVNITRARHNLALPANFMLVLASNPCPCGNFGNPEKPCVCAPGQIKNYRKKLSGPLMDRVDLFINVPAVKYEKLAAQNPNTADSGQEIKERIAACRQIQKERFGGAFTNSRMNIAQVKEFCPLDQNSRRILQTAVDSGRLSARGYHRVLKVSRTIADLENAPDIKLNHVSEALAYRPAELI